MTIWQRLKASMRSQGPGATLIKLWIWATDHLYDIGYGLDTCKVATLDNLTINSQNKEQGYRYQPTRVVPLRRLLQQIMPLVPANSVLVDLGCGKGRVVLIASQFGFKEVRGIEFAHELCEIARKNCAKFRAIKGISVECSIIEADATLYTIRPDETVFFLFNPFDEVILGKVLANIETSLKNFPRKILILYYNPKAGGVVEQSRYFARAHEYNFWGYRFVVYETRG